MLCGDPRHDISAPPFDDIAPVSDELTEYDRAHIKLYMRLLDAADDGAEWTEAVNILFGIDPALEPVRARQVHDSHLARARWMTQSGYRQLLRRPTDRT
ncbi:DNA -binding domain-containing protein [Sphingobium yanoikuyae]|uniref:DNA -binding domain-containing protein n=1 Tax=Sphingobium yanoikuyae TaxID=13690 RepID=UPI000262BA88